MRVMFMVEPDDPSLPFVMRVVSNPKTAGVLIGSSAMRAAGAQTEFVAHNIAQASALGCSLILRACVPPQYNKHRGPKSGVNLSKTSTQGFFKGALVADERFARVSRNEKTGVLELLPHDKKDSSHLKLPVSHQEYQHRMQLDLNMQDILRELGDGGDLQVIAYNADTGLLRFEYKEGKGPPRDQFNGQFVVDLHQGKDTPQFYARPWDKPENQVGWDPDKKVIKKPDALKDLPDEVYERVFNQSFLLSSSEGKLENPNDLVAAEVFANRPRSSDEFLAVLKDLQGEGSDIYQSVKDLDDLGSILETLSKSGHDDVILSVYDGVGVIVAGDWDGLALGHPASLKPEFKKVWNTFDPVNGGDQQKGLIRASQQYLNELKEKASSKPLDQQSAMDKHILSIDKFKNIVSDFALARAGCITAHEFLFQQVLNHAYRDANNKYYGENFDMAALQVSMDAVLRAREPGVALPALQEMLRAELNKNLSLADKAPASAVKEMLAQHLSQHLQIAFQSGATSYSVPHPQHDVNVHELYQHGFDMRNPYGSNLEGAWMMVNPDGGVIYGKTQEQLIEVLLTSDYLEQNHIDVTWAAKMDAGWDSVIARQIELDQTVPDKTLLAYAVHLKNMDIEPDAKTISEIHKAVNACASIKETDNFFTIKKAADDWIQSRDEKKVSAVTMSSVVSTASRMASPLMSAAASTAAHTAAPLTSVVVSKPLGTEVGISASQSYKAALQAVKSSNAKVADMADDERYKPAFK